MHYPNVKNIPALLSPYNFPENLLLPLVIPLDHDHDSIAGFEIGILVVERVPAHDDRAVWEVANTPPAYLPAMLARRRQPMG